MIEDWILKIRQNSRFYCPETWKYRISGNVIEFSVPQKCTLERKIYRCSVITIGQILKSLSCKIEKEGAHFLIQSYPNLESPHVIASIRMEEHFSKSQNPFPLLKDYSTFKSETEKLLKLSENYHFTLSPSCKTVTGLLRNYFNVTAVNTWFVLSSKNDNPFTWLDLGYWKETILKNCNNELNIHSPKIFDSCLNHEPHEVALKYPDREVFQALLAAKIL